MRVGHLLGATRLLKVEVEKKKKKKKITTVFAVAAAVVVASVAAVVSVAIARTWARGQWKRAGRRVMRTTAYHEAYSGALSTTEPMVARADVAQRTTRA